MLVQAHRPFGVEEAHGSIMTPARTGFGAALRSTKAQGRERRAHRRHGARCEALLVLEPDQHDGISGSASVYLTDGRIARLRRPPARAFEPEVFPPPPRRSRRCGNSIGSGPARRAGREAGTRPRRRFSRSALLRGAADHHLQGRGRAQVLVEPMEAVARSPAGAVLRSSSRKPGGRAMVKGPKLFERSSRSGGPASWVPSASHCPRLRVARLKISRRSMGSPRATRRASSSRAVSLPSILSWATAHTHQAWPRRRSCPRAPPWRTQPCRYWSRNCSTARLSAWAGPAAASVTHRRTAASAATPILHADHRAPRTSISLDRREVSPSGGGRRQARRRRHVGWTTGLPDVHLSRSSGGEPVIPARR